MLKAVTVLPAGFGVLVTRPAGQAENLCRLIEDGGGTAIRLPLLEIETVAGGGAHRLGRLDDLDWLVFTSANAVRSAFALRGPQWLEGNRAKTAAIGQATAQALEEKGVAVDLKPKQQFNSEALLAEPAFAAVSGRRFLIVRGVGGRELLAETLRERGGLVEYAEVYRRRPPKPDDLPGLLALWRAGGIGAVTITSSEALANLAHLMAGSDLELLLRTPMVVIGERLGKQAREQGYAQVIATEAGDAAIFDAVARIGRALIKTHQPRG